MPEILHSGRESRAVAREMTQHRELCSCRGLESASQYPCQKAHLKIQMQGLKSVWPPQAPCTHAHTSPKYTGIHIIKNSKNRFYYKESKVSLQYMSVVNAWGP